MPVRRLVIAAAAVRAIVQETARNIQSDMTRGDIMLRGEKSPRDGISVIAVMPVK